MPGLSEAANKTGDETTIEKYKRKQKEKREARKAKAKTKESGKEKSGEEKFKIDDDFFAAGSSSDDEGGMMEEESDRENERRPATAEELALLLAPDNADGVVAVLEDSEKPKTKKRGKKGNKGKENDEDEDGFKVDVSDERFKALHEDHTFSIDPSNPQCVGLFPCAIRFTDMHLISASRRQRAWMHYSANVRKGDGILITIMKTELLLKRRRRAIRNR